MNRISSFALLPSSPGKGAPGWRVRAFTLIELLVVISIIAILAGLLVPALNSGKGKAQTVLCLNSKKQLQLAWQLYADDHEDKLVLHGQPLPKTPRTAPQYWWAQGTMTFDSDHADNTNIALLSDPQYALLGGYVSDAAVFRCSADKSAARFSGSLYRRVRGVSLNGYLGRIADCFGLEPYQIGPVKVPEVPRPSEQFAFLDEHPDSIRGVSFWLWKGEGPDAKLVSYPSPLHRGGATLSFVDGHADSQRWKDKRTRPPVRYDGSLPEDYSPNNPDIAWLQERTIIPPEPEE